MEQRSYRFMNKRVYWRVPDEVRAEIIRLAAHGATRKEICSRFPVSSMTVLRLMGPLGGVMRAEQWRVSDARLSVDERVEIALGLSHGESYRAIAAGIGRSPSTVCREVNAGGGRSRYRPMTAHHAAHARARRPKPTKLACTRALRERGSAELLEFWSPEQIARRLREDFSDDTSMRISHETIYKSLYV